MSWGAVASLVLGAVLALAGGVATELWRNWRMKRSAARILVQELVWNFGVLASVRMRLTDGDSFAEEMPWSVEEMVPRRLMRLSDLRDDAWKDQQLTLATHLRVDEFIDLQKAYRWLAAVRLATERPNPDLIDRGLVGFERLTNSMREVAGIRDPTRGAGRRFVRLTCGLPRDERVLLDRAFKALRKPPSDVDAWVEKSLEALEEGRDLREIKAHPEDRRLLRLGSRRRR